MKHYAKTEKVKSGVGKDEVMGSTPIISSKIPFILAVFRAFARRETANFFGFPANINLLFACILSLPFCIFIIHLFFAANIAANI